MPGRSCVGELKAPDKPFDISKRAVWEAYEKVRANKGAPGVDKVSLAEFEKDLKNNLYKIWNRTSSGSYFPPPVRAVEIPKPHGGGTRTLGVPTVADRIAQTVVAGVLERGAEPVFHPDSHGYRPGRSAIDAVAACRERCWRHDWVIDLDIRTFFDSVPWDLMLKAVAAHTEQPWVLLYVRRWLAAPLQLPDGTLRQRDRGTQCQGDEVVRGAVDSSVVIFKRCTESDNGLGAWRRPGCLAGCAGFRARGSPGRGDATVRGQAAVVPQTCTTAGAVRVVTPRGACENGCLDLIVWSR